MALWPKGFYEVGMKKEILRLLIAFFVVFQAFTGELFSLDTQESVPIKIALIAETETIQPGHPFWVAIQLDIDEGWHAYWKNPCHAGIPIEVDWELPEGFSAGELEWQFPQRFDLDGIISYGYQGNVWLLALITPPVSLETDRDVEIKANVNWLVCSKTNCTPGFNTVATVFPVKSREPKKIQEHISGFEHVRALIPAKNAWKMQAERKNGLIELQLKTSQGFKPIITSAEFFPEQNNAIDCHVPAVLLSGEQNDYTIVLKETTEETKGTALKGVLVVEEKTSSSTLKQAVQVNIEIQGDSSGDEAVALEDSLKSSNEIDVKPSPPLKEFDGGVGMAILLAFAGGALLNLMPCVLPVISFKILNFVKLTGSNRAQTLQHGIAFSGGILVSFWVLAGLMLVFQMYGKSVGWGFQLQEPIFVAILAVLLFIFSLNMFGVFELGIFITQLASKADSSHRLGLLGSFLNGVLATAVAAPCSGPFLGSAIGFAMTGTALQTIVIFTSLGIGMALPYLIFSASPSLMRFIPRPGPWMGTFKELMGFLILATVLWLLWVFEAQTSPVGGILLLIALFVLALGCWIYGKWGAPSKSPSIRLTSGVGVLTCLMIACYSIAIALTYQASPFESTKLSDKAIVWEPFSESRVDELRKQGIPVFVDFTAKWCLICQANHFVLSTPEVSEKFDQLGVVRMKADWTKNDPSITEALRKFGRNGVPLYLLFGVNPKEAPQILPQVLTPDTLLKYLQSIEVQITDKKYHDNIAIH
jgi:thiol:disulfide interchange protein